MRFALLLLLVSACHPSNRLRYADGHTAGVPASAYEHYIRGRMAALDGDHKLAVAEFRLASTIAPDQPELRVAAAEELLAAGMTEHARQELRLILERWPRDAPAWVLLGRAHARAGDAAEAIAAYEKALAIDAADEDTYLLMAVAARQRGDADFGEKIYQRMATELPYSVEAHYRLGRVLLLARKLLDAEKELSRAVELDPAHVDARVALAETLRQAGQATRAGATLREAFERSGDDPGVGERLFRVLLEGGDQQAALDLLRTLDADWREPGVRVSLGYLFLQLRRGGEALATARGVLARDDRVHAARVLAGRALAQNRQYADAIATLLEVPPEGDEYPEARAFAADLHARDGRVKEGVKLVEEALERRPDDPALVTTRAALYEKLGDTARAGSILDDALAKAATSEELIYARAALEERAGDFDKAIGMMQKLLDADAESVLALNFIGYAYANRGVKLADSERLLRRAVELRPDDGYVLDSWGWLLLQTGRLDDARDALERADRLSPHEPEILLHLGELYVRRGDSGKARETFERALALDPDDRVRSRLEESVRTLEAKAP